MITPSEPGSRPLPLVELGADDLDQRQDAVLVLCPQVQAVFGDLGGDPVARTGNRTSLVATAAPGRSVNPRSGARSPRSTSSGKIAQQVISHPREIAAASAQVIEQAAVILGPQRDDQLDVGLDVDQSLKHLEGVVPIADLIGQSVPS